MKIVISIVVLALVAGLLFWESLLSLMIAPPKSSQALSQPAIIEVPKGATLAAVSYELAEKGLIRSPRLFRLYARLKGESHGLKMGEYEIPVSANPKAILDILTSGKSKLYSVTFPEGANIFEVASALDKTGHYSGLEFLKKVRDPKYARQLLGEDAPSLEGYLFPETYNYTKYTTLDGLIRAMVNRFQAVFNEISQDYDGPFSRHQIVTLASVIEKETGAPEERALISSVFHNRLKKGMRIQSDPTIIYGYWVETGEPLKNIRKSDILRATPYNTYTVKALPAGPVANPGAEALRAAMFPANSDYLYFVSRNDGTHIFTTNYKDHQRAVRDFQLNRRAREGKSWRDLSN